ncbi:MAG: Na+/H+ antiporter subunit E [Pseudomonadota bacterium]|nr:Na+/H+ antiporter subunit E [Pseudomonadota bacterium]
MRAIGLLTVLAVTWLLLSGIYDHGLLYWLGAASCLTCVWVAHRMDVVDHEGVPLPDLGLRILPYWGWLFIEIVKANIDVIRRIARLHPDISPTLVRSPALQATDLGKVIYANSITLTPGTFTLDISEEGMLVHAISRDGADGVLSDDMNRRCAALESARLHRTVADARLEDERS